MKGSNILSLQVLRGLAAVAVVCHHAFRAITVNNGQLEFTSPVVIDHHAVMEFGAAGVDIFFVLSGFLMIYISDRYVQGSASVGHFMSQRLIRIWPLYAIVTAGVCMLMLLKYLMTHQFPFDFQWYRLLSFVFIPSFNQQMQVQPILGVGWTLNYEMAFYLMFALALMFNRSRVFVGLSAILLAFYWSGALFAEDSVGRYFMHNTIIFEFWFGALLGHLQGGGYLKGRPWWYCLLGITVLLACAYWPPSPAYRWLTCGVGAVLVFTGMLKVNTCYRWPRAWVILGDASYSIYLVHVVVIYSFLMPLLAKLYAIGLAPLQAELAALLLITVSIAIGLMCHYWLEKPLLNFCRHLQFKKALNKGARLPVQ